MFRIKFCHAFRVNIKTSPILANHVMSLVLITDNHYTRSKLSTMVYKIDKQTVQFYLNKHQPLHNQSQASPNKVCILAHTLLQWRGVRSTFSYVRKQLNKKKLKNNHFFFFPFKKNLRKQSNKKILFHNLGLPIMGLRFSPKLEMKQTASKA